MVETKEDDVPYEEKDLLSIEINDQQLLKELMTHYAEKSVDSKTAIQGLVLVNVLVFINSLIQKVDLLAREYNNVEDLLYPKSYLPMLVENKVILPKTLIAGYDNNSLKFTIQKINDDIDELKDNTRIFTEELTRAKQNIVKEIEHRDKKLKWDICKQCSTIQNIEQVLYFILTGDHLLNRLKELSNKLTEDIKIQLPASASALQNAKRFRKLLTDTQAVARETELLCVYFLKEILKEHGQIRRDYQEIQSQTNQIYNQLSVSLAEIYLDGSSLSYSLKMIMKYLKNIRGDLNTLKIITIMLMRPTPDSPIQVSNMLSKLQTKGLDL